MNLIDVEWDPPPTDPTLLRSIRSAVKSAVSPHDVSRLRATLLAPPLCGRVPHEARGAIWLLLLGLRPEDLLAEDAGDFARAAREAVAADTAADVIERDVERTRPGLARFKQSAVRGALSRLLSLFCQRRGISYVQGLNELLAPFVLLADTGGNPRIVFSLYSAFLTRYAPCMLDTSETKVFDVLKRAFKYFGRLLLYHDPVLFWRLERENMTPDLYATSWFVTLYARNFTVETVLALWDLLLLEDNPLGTTFFGLALLLSRRDELLAIDASRLPETLMMLGVKGPEDVHALWAQAGILRAGHTPPSFQRLMTDRLLVPPGDAAAAGKGLNAARFMQASVCLQTTPDDLSSAGEAQFFTWDCRTRAEYDAGHLAQAAFLELEELRSALGQWEGHEGAVRELENALRLCEPLDGNSHICLVGSGVKIEDNDDVNLLALYLTERGVSYVSSLRGGFRAAVAAAMDDDSLSSVELVDYDPSKHEAAVLKRQALRETYMKRKAMKEAAVYALQAAQEREAAIRKSFNAAATATRTAAASMFGGLGGGYDADAAIATGESGPGTRSPGALPDGIDPTGGTGGGAAMSQVEPDEDSNYGGMGKILSALVPDLALASPNSTLSSESRAAFSPNGPGPSPVAGRGKELENIGSQVTDGTGDGGVDQAAATRALQQMAMKDLPPIKRALSSVADSGHRGGGSPAGDDRKYFGTGSVESSPRLMHMPSSLMSPKPGEAPPAAPALPVSPTEGDMDMESPIRKKPGTPSRGFFGANRSPWGRDARPGWLSDESLDLPLVAMPKGFTVNVMDDRVMAGLRLFPCRARNGRTPGIRGGSGGEFKRRYVGVSSNYFMLLSPHNNRSHLLEVKLIRLLRDIVRITFKRSRPELVTFEILSALEGDVPNEQIVCIMPEGLNQCVELIKDYLEQKDDAGTSTSPTTDTVPTPATTPASSPTGDSGACAALAMSPTPGEEYHSALPREVEPSATEDQPSATDDESNATEDEPGATEEVSSAGKDLFSAASGEFPPIDKPGTGEEGLSTVGGEPSASKVESSAIQHLSSAKDDNIRSEPEPNLCAQPQDLPSSSKARRLASSTSPVRLAEPAPILPSSPEMAASPSASFVPPLTSNEGSPRMPLSPPPYPSISQTQTSSPRTHRIGSAPVELRREVRLSREKLTPRKTKSFDPSHSTPPPSTPSTLPPRVPAAVPNSPSDAPGKRFSFDAASEKD